MLKIEAGKISLLNFSVKKKDIYHKVEVTKEVKCVHERETKKRVNVKW